MEPSREGWPRMVIIGDELLDRMPSVPAEEPEPDVVVTITVTIRVRETKKKI